jgi:hypothetical protein
MSTQKNATKAVTSFPKVSEDAIKSEIIAVSYHRGSDIYGPNEHDPLEQYAKDYQLDTVMVATVLLRNGTVVLGFSRPVDPNNFDERLGRIHSYNDAVRQIWPLMGYELRSRMHALKQLEVEDTLGEALTRLTAFRLGNDFVLRPSDADQILRHFEGTDHQEEGGETYAVVPPTVDQIAEFCHEANRNYCLMQGDTSQPHWAEAPQWQKDSAIQGVEFALANPLVTPADMHANWLKQKENDGWVYGDVKDPDKKEHPCMVSYDQLPQSQQIKDYIFLTSVRTLAGRK